MKKIDIENMNDEDVKHHKVRIGIKVLGSIVQHDSDGVYEFTPVKERSLILYIAKNNLPYSICSERLDKLLIQLRNDYSSHSEELFNLIN